MNEWFLLAILGLLVVALIALVLGELDSRRRRRDAERLAAFGRERFNMLPVAMVTPHYLVFTLYQDPGFINVHQYPHYYTPLRDGEVGIGHVDGQLSRICLQGGVSDYRVDALCV